MKVILLVVGKTTNPHITAIINDYLSRINHYLPFSLVVIPELRGTHALSQQQQKELEGDKILHFVQPNDTLVLLDEHGAERDSLTLAQWLSMKQQIAQRLVFAIGGSYGFSEAVYQRANEQLSLSRMTFPHQLVRIFFLEQLYRACTILKGEPYHHP